MNAQITTLPVTEYRVFDEYEKEVLSTDSDFDLAEESLLEWRGKRQHNEIILLAVVGA